MTFILLIHENPGSSDKACGHVGTELILKASTQLQIRRVSDKDDTEIFQIVFRKIRFKKRYAPVYVTYDEDLETLVTVDYSEDKKQEKEDSNSSNELHAALADAFSLQSEYSRAELASFVSERLNGEFNENTVARKLAEISREGQFNLNINGGGRFVAEKRRRETYYVFYRFLKMKWEKIL